MVPQSGREATTCSTVAYYSSPSLSLRFCSDAVHLVQYELAGTGEASEEAGAVSKPERYKGITVPQLKETWETTVTQLAR